MQIRDRIRELRRVPANQLRPNARNWRTHSAEQRDTLRGVLAEIGYAGALLARELDDGTLELIDGHLRAETTPDAMLPVLVLDVSESEALKLLATFDPLAALAQADATAIAALVADVDTDNSAVQTLLDQLVAGSDGFDPNRVDPDSVNPDSVDPIVAEQPAEGAHIPSLHQVVIECRDEDEQRTVYEQMRAQGFKCRVLCL